MKKSILNIAIAVSAFIFLTLSSEAELKSMFINVNTYNYELHELHNNINRYKGINDCFANSANNIISILYDSEFTSQKEILANITSLGYKIKNEKEEDDILVNYFKNSKKKTNKQKIH